MNVYDIFAKLGLDSSEYDKGLAQAKTNAGTFGNVFSKIGGVVAKAAKAGAVAIGAASTAVAGLGAASVRSYAEYEQLVGGVQKLYGNMGMNLEDYAKSVGKTTDEVRTDWQNLDKAQNLVLSNAKNAYKTAGMSANQYMNTATSFSASLIKSLGGDTVKAAEQTDVAMKAISDNFNTFGGDIGMIQSAFMGFAKQNYMMLDNLKLGYGGTKTEMENLIKDANEYAKSIGQASDLSIDSFSDIVTAIDLIQQKQQIAGTTMREAMTTIEGSANATKAAWENVLTAIASGEGLSESINGLISSIFGEKEGEGLLNQVIPRIEQAMKGIGEFIGTAAPFISEKIPQLIEATVPSMVSGGIQLLGALADGFTQSIPTLLEVVMNLANQVISTLTNYDWVGAASGLAEKISGMFDPATNGMETQLLAIALAMVTLLTEGVAQSIPILLPAAMDLIANFLNFLANQTPNIINTAMNLIVSLAEGLTNPASLSNMLNAALNLIVTLGKGLIDNIPKLTAAVPTIVQNLVQTLIRFAPQLLISAAQLIIQLELGLIKNIPTLVQAVPEIIGSLVGAFVSMFGEIFQVGSEIIIQIHDGIKSLDPAEWGRDMIDSFIDGIKSMIGRVRDAAESVANTVKSYIGFSEPELGPLSNFHTYAPDMMKLFAKGIADNEDIVSKQIEKSFSLPDISQNISANGGGSGSSVGNIYITVNGAEGQSEERLAEIVSNRLLHEMGMKQAVSYAVT